MRTLSCSVSRNGFTPFLGVSRNSFTPFLGVSRNGFTPFLGVFLGVLLGTVTLAAHHSFAAQYDADKPVTMSGTVTRIEWTNPHFHFFVNVKDEKGTVTEWAFEGYPPNMLVRQGWKKDVSLKPGMMVTVQGWRARIEPHLIAAREVTFADGSKLTAGPPAGTGGN